MPDFPCYTNEVESQRYWFVTIDSGRFRLIIDDSKMNFSVDFAKHEDPQGDRIVVTFNGKFLRYQW
jgi:hypothetical protein